MSYCVFQLKKVCKNKLTPLSFSLIVIILITVFFMNKRTESYFTLEHETQTAITDLRHQDSKLEAKLTQISSKSPHYQETRSNLLANKQTLKQNQTILAAIKANHLAKAYTLIWLQKKKERQYLNSSEIGDQQAKFDAAKNVRFYGYLRKQPLAYESQKMPVTGWQFWLQINAQYLPYLFSLIALFTLTLLLTDSYHQRIKTSRILPLLPGKLAIYDIITGVVLIVGGFILINLVIFLLATLVSGSGSLSYPVNTFHLNDAQVTISCVPIGNLIVPVLSLQVLNMLFWVAFVRLLAQIMRDKLPTLLLALLVIIGGNLAITVLKPLQRISSLFPITYLNAVDVATGSLSMRFHNAQLNIKNGIICLIISIVLIFVLTIIFEHKQDPVNYNE